MRAIDADELYRAKFHGVAEIIPPDEHSPESYKRGWNDAIDAIADKSCTPTIEPERKRGRWIIYTISPFDGEDVKCSECGQRGCAPYWEYCPNCGTKMEEVEEECAIV